VRNCPTGIDLSLDDLVASNGQYFGVAEAPQSGPVGFVGDEHLVAMLHEMDELEVRDCLVIGLAAIKIDGPANAIVEWTSKIIGNQRVECRTVLIGIGLITSPHERYEVLHCGRSQHL
jgi:hypothetical protein